MKYMSTFEAAEKWGISHRRVSILCNQDRIPGAQRAGSRWIIPEDAEKLREFFAEHQEPAALEKISSAS